MIWTEEQKAFLAENYPKKGKAWCVQAMGLAEYQVRYKASAMGLVSRGISDAWKEKQAAHSAMLTGRKRPEQADVMRKAIHEKGLHIQPEETRIKTGDAVREWIKNNGHPRGMAGKKHSEAARSAMSDSGRKRSEREGPDGIASRTLKGMKTRAANGTLAPPRFGTTWKAAWREIGGKRCFFRSAWEANYARYLQFLKENKSISEWDHEPDTFWFDAIKRGARSYLPDFRVTENCGRVVYHEVKGWMDDRSKTKIRRMAKYHPSVELLVIDAKSYKAIAAKASRLVGGWE